MLTVIAEGGLLLASASPRRRGLLAEAGVTFSVQPVSVVEAPRPGEPPPQLALRLAWAKARAAREMSDQGVVIVAADTIVVDGDRVLGKPGSRQEAMAMLLALAGRPHEVITGVAVLDRAGQEEIVTITRTQLALRRMDRREVADYVQGGSPLDKAGAYGIQDSGFNPVDMDTIRGCYTNVMGLPLCTLERGLAALGWTVGVDLTAACRAYHPHPVPAMAGGGR